MEIKITIEQLESLLNQQKQIVIEKLLRHTYYYNTESTAGAYKTLPIDEVKFADEGMKAKFPDDLNVLKKYIH